MKNLKTFENLNEGEDISFEELKKLAKKLAASVTVLLEMTPASIPPIYADDVDTAKKALKEYNNKMWQTYDDKIAGRK
jgi:hypothetical protein